MNAIGVGVIGLGNSGWYYHAQSTLEPSKDFDVVAVSAQRAERTQAGADRFGAVGYQNWHDLIADDRVELVIVATPHDLHAPMAIAALEAGKHVVVEKPMATTKAQCDAMIAAAKSAGRILSVFQNRRWEPSFQIIKDLIGSGELGTVWRTEERRMHAGKYTVAGTDRAHAGTEPAAWAHTTAGGGGVSYLIAPHLIDHQLQLHGTPTTITAQMHTFASDDVEHYLDLHLHYPQVLCRIEVFRELAFDLPKWAVFGTRGTVVCHDFGTLIHTRADGSVREYGGLAPLQGCDEFYDDLAAAIRGAGPEPVCAQDGALVVQVLELAHRSAAQGGIPLPVV